jgi:hypothetical protein
MADATTPTPGQKGYWRWLHNRMLAALGDGSFLRFNGYTVPNRTFQYRSLSEYRSLLDWVKARADVEDGKAPYRGRTYAGNRGRG